ncbi:MAG: cell wall hydrolase [Candidatus Kaiserbacteria bacterium]|nr:MAG: cell wall hydrolase [Candidatus Kaiserbacteria bacterium]
MGMDRIDRSRIEGAKKLVSDFLKDESSSGQGPSLQETVKVLRTLLAAGTVYAGAAVSDAGPAQAREGAKIERAQQELYSKEDLTLLSENVYHEAKGESPLGQLGVVQVTLARLAAGEFGRTLRDVILAKNQFSWTRDEKVRVSPEDQEAVKKLQEILGTFMRGKEPAHIVRELSKITYVPTSALFYKRTDWNEHDPKEERMSEKTKKLFKSLRVVGYVDKHSFYAKPIDYSKAKW